MLLENASTSLIFQFFQLIILGVLIEKQWLLQPIQIKLYIKSTFLLLMFQSTAEYIINLLGMPYSLPLIQKSLITFNSSTKKAILKEPVQSLVEASYSSILTLASYLLFHFPSLIPPSFPQINLDGNTTDEKFPQTYLTYNRLYQPWCDYLSELFLNNKVSQNDDVCHMYGEVSQEFIAQLNSDLFLITQISPQKHNKVLYESLNSKETVVQEEKIKYQNTNKKSKKIAIVNFALSQLRTDHIKPKMHLIGLFTGIFFNQGDQWSDYNILKRHYPTIDEYKQIDTIILSGSSLSVNDEAPQVVEFVQTLRQAIKNNPNLKVLGVCFGHQTLAKMFGGKIVQKKLLAGVENIDFDEKLIQNTPYFKRTQLGESTFELSQYHKDFVVQIPQNFNILAQSKTCKIQSLMSKDMKILSFQFHPEYSAQYIRGYQTRLQHYQIFDIKSPYSHTQRGSIKHDSSLWEIRKIIRNFIDWDAAEAQ